MADEKQLMDTIVFVRQACDALPLDDRLHALELAWMGIAQEARGAALAFPGGFQAERDRQLLVLNNMADLVKEDTPDIELERLWQEGDHEGVQEYIRTRMNREGA